MDDMNSHVTLLSPEVQFIDEQLHPIVQRALAEEVVIPAYARARRTTSDWHPAFKRDAIMVNVHNEIQNGLLGLSETFPELAVTIEPNSSGTAHYARLRSGRLLVTASQTRSRGSIPRSSNFRSELASRFNPMLFEPEAVGELTFAVLAHGVHREDPIQYHPSYIEILVPDEASQQWICHIDLMKRYDLYPSSVNTLQDLPKVHVTPKSSNITEDKKRDEKAADKNSS